MGQLDRERLQRLDRLMVLTEGFQVDIGTLEVIGSGSFGSVYRGKKDGEVIAYKVMNEDSGTSEADLKSFLREFKTLK